MNQLGGLQSSRNFACEITALFWFAGEITVFVPFHPLGETHTRESVAGGNVFVLREREHVSIFGLFSEKRQPSLSRVGLVPLGAQPDVADPSGGSRSGTSPSVSARQTVPPWPATASSTAAELHDG